MEDLDRTYSRDQQRFGSDLEVVATPVALVRSVTSRSQHSSRSRSRNPEQSSRAVYLDSLEKDVDADLVTDKENQIEQVETPRSHSRASSLSSNERHVESNGGQSPERRILRFEDGDPENPFNWPWWKKCYALFVAIMSVMNSTISSTLAGGATDPIADHFNQHDEYKLILPTSIFLVGYVCGPMIWGPLSEQYGRKGTMIVSFAILTIFSIASAVAPSFAALVIFRLIVGIGGSAAISVVGGICADVYGDPVSRGRSMAIFMAATTFGPILGPPVSGFISVLSWSWAFWIGAILAGATWPLFYFFPETYGPAILKRQAKRLRKETGDESIVAPLELEKTDLNHIITVVLTRPLRMIIFEPLVLFTCIYISYACIYGFNRGEAGLAFLPMGVGAIISAMMWLAWDSILARAQRLQRPWSSKEEMRRLPLACVAGPFFVISSFWLGWTARPDIHWIVPILAGILFGMGYLCLFMALLNYLVDAYEIFAASAMAAASLTRSSFGAILPFATRPMYRTMGIAWATSLLGFFSLVLCVVPFVFIRWGEDMRKRSKFCQYLVVKKREEEERKSKERGKKEATNGADC